jgi:hypothetical protein
MRYPLRGIYAGDGTVESLKEFQISIDEISGLTGLGVSGNVLTDQGDGTAIFISPSRIELDLAYKAAYNSDTYSEITRVSGEITEINIWETSAMSNKLFTKSIIRTSGDITQVSIVDDSTSASLTTDITRLSGNIITIDKNFVGPS